MKEVREADNKPEREAIENSTMIAEEIADLNPNTEMDFKELKEHVKSGGWRLGLLVARNVRNDYGSLSREKPWELEGISRSTWYRQQDETTVNSVTVVSKVHSRTCSKITGISHTEILRYLKAWNLAVADGLPILSSSDLVPGQSVSFDALDDSDKPVFTQKSWDNYFKTPSGGSDPTVEKFFGTLSKYDETAVREWMQAKNFELGSGSDHHKVYESICSASQALNLAKSLYKRLAVEMNWTVEGEE